MSAVVPVPEGTEIFLDARGGARSLRVTWHREAEVMLLSVWRDNVCVSSFRMSIEEVPALIESLRAGLDEAYDDAVQASGTR